MEFFSVTQGWVLGMEIETRPWKLPSPASPTVGVLGETPVLLGQLSRVREGRSEKLSRSLNLNSQGRKHTNNDFKNNNNIYIYSNNNTVAGAVLGALETRFPATLPGWLCSWSILRKLSSEQLSTGQGLHS